MKGNLMYRHGNLGKNFSERITTEELCLGWNMVSNQQGTYDELEFNSIVQQDLTGVSIERPLFNIEPLKFIF